VIFDWNLGNMIYSGLITLRLCGFPFVEIGVVSADLLLGGGDPGGAAMLPGNATGFPD